MEEIYYEPKIFYYDPNELLFSKRCLKRRGEYVEPEKINYKYAVYNKIGKLEKVYKSVEEINKENPIYLIEGIKRAIKTEKRYKDKFFRQVEEGKEAEPTINVILCWINGVPYSKQTEISNDLGVSRQAVSACVKRKGKTLGGYKVEWNE